MTPGKPTGAGGDDGASPSDDDESGSDDESGGDDDGDVRRTEAGADDSLKWAPRPPMTLAKARSVLDPRAPAISLNSVEDRRGMDIDDAGNHCPGAIIELADPLEKQLLPAERQHYGRRLDTARC